MALTPLQEAYNRQTPNFDQKLDQVVGAVRSIKATEIAKQQTQQKLESEKELIEFEYDLRTQQQKELQGQKAKQQQQESYFEALEESYEESKEKRNELATIQNQQQYRNVARYNLFNPTLKIEQNPETKRYGTVIQDGEQYIDEVQFRNTLTNQAVFADDLRRAEDGDLNLAPSRNIEGIVDGETRTIRTIGSDNYKEVINKIKDDPQTARAYSLIADSLGTEQLFSTSEPVQEESTSKAPKFNYSFFGDLRDNLQKNGGVRQYQIVDDNFFSDTIKTFSIDYNASIGGIESQIEGAFKRAYMDDDEEFNLANIGRNGIQAILSQDEKLLSENVPEDQMDYAENLMEIAKSDPQAQELLTNYVQMGSMFDSWRNEAGSTASKENTYFDYMNLPETIKTEADFRKVFSVADTPSKMSAIREASSTFGSKYREDVQSVFNLFE